MFGIRAIKRWNAEVVLEAYEEAKNERRRKLEIANPHLAPGFRKIRHGLTYHELSRLGLNDFQCAAYGER